MESTKKVKKYALIDDDVTYTTIMTRCAEQHGILLETYSSLEELGYLGLMGNYDGVIVDYDLGTHTGVEIAEYADAFFRDLPIILVSEKDRQPLGGRNWPKSIKSFIKKSEGYSQVLLHSTKTGGEKAIS